MARNLAFIKKADNTQLRYQRKGKKKSMKHNPLVVVCWINEGRCWDYSMLNIHIPFAKPPPPDWGVSNGWNLIYAHKHKQRHRHLSYTYILGFLYECEWPFYPLSAVGILMTTYRNQCLLLAVQNPFSTAPVPNWRKCQIVPMISQTYATFLLYARKTKIDLRRMIMMTYPCTFCSYEFDDISIAFVQL